MTLVRHYRKKPVVIQAIRWFQQPDPLYNLDDVLEFLGSNGQFDGSVIRIQTLEGIMAAKPGDWIIRGVQGEFYPCNPEIFSATYEPA